MKRKNDENVKKRQKVLVFLLLLFILFAIFKSYQSTRINNPEYTICELKPKNKKVNIASSSNSLFIYYVNGNKYIAQNLAFKNRRNIFGEKYLLKYEKENPNKSLIIDEKPVFLTNESTSFTYGFITRVYRFRLPFFNSKPYLGVEFSYKIGEKEYTKSQVISRGYSKTVLDSIEKNEIPVIVEYWNKDLRRSIISPDKLLKSKPNK
jgi:hypothetical protein